MEKISSSNARTLINGPIGSGKKLIAQTIHKISKRSNSLANIIDFSSLAQDQLINLFEDDVNNFNKNLNQKISQSRRVLTSMV